MLRPNRLTLVMGAALLPRLLFAIAVFLRCGPAGFHTFDSSSYILPARELSAAGTFTVDGVPDIYRTPGYSLCLVPGVLLRQVELWAVILHLALAAGTACGLYLLARRIFPGERAGLWAAILYALDPLSILQTAQIASETAFTFALVWCLFFAARYLSHPPSSSVPPRDRLPALWVAAGLLACATLIRPISLYLPYALAAFLAAALWRQGRLRAFHAAHLALFLAVAAGPAFAWQYRNAKVTGYHEVSSIVAVNAYYYQAAAVQARLAGTSGLEVRKAMGYERELYLTEHPRERPEGQAEHFRALQGEALAVLRPHWPLYAGLHLAGILKMLFNPGASGYLVIFNRYYEVEALAGVHPEGGALQALLQFRRFRPAFLWPNAILGILLAAYYFCALRGLAQARSAWIPGVGLLLLAGAYFAAVSGGPSAVSRFRHPVMPIICIFAGAGCVSTGRRVRV